tara:strand:- start:3671 stop:3844 length:174 start_codon:yes stop_codon:yes gene_type:complete
MGALVAGAEFGEGGFVDGGLGGEEVVHRQYGFAILLAQLNFIPIYFIHQAEKYVIVL